MVPRVKESWFIDGPKLTNSVVHQWLPGNWSLHQETFGCLQLCHQRGGAAAPSEVVDTALVVDDYPCMLSAQHELYAPWRRGVGATG